MVECPGPLGLLPNRTCLQVDNVVAAKEHMESEGAPLIRDAASGEAIHYGLRSTPIIFLDPVSTSGVTCELQQVTCGKSSDKLC